MAAAACKIIIDAGLITTVYEEARHDKQLAAKLAERPDIGERLASVCRDVAEVAGVRFG